MKIFETTFDLICINITDYASWTIKIVLMMHKHSKKKTDLEDKDIY